MLFKNDVEFITIELKSKFVGKSVPNFLSGLEKPGVGWSGLECPGTQFDKAHKTPELHRIIGWCLVLLPK